MRHRGKRGEGEKERGKATPKVKTKWDVQEITTRYDKHVHLLEDKLNNYSFCRDFSHTLVTVTRHREC